jgi:hypothetical protein
LDLQLCNIENSRVFAETVKALSPYKRHTISEIEYEIGRENEFNYNTFVVDHLIPKLESCKSNYHPITAALCQTSNKLSETIASFENIIIKPVRPYKKIPVFPVS